MRSRPLIRSMTSGPSSLAGAGTWRSRPIPICRRSSIGFAAPAERLSHSRSCGAGLASRYELAYGPDIDLAQIARSVPATTLAALLEIVGHLVDDPFPGKSA